MASSPSSSSPSSSTIPSIPAYMLQEHIAVLRNSLDHLPDLHPNRTTLEQELRAAESMPLALPPPPPSQQMASFNFNQPLPVPWQQQQNIGGSTSVPSYSGNSQPYHTNGNADSSNGNFVGQATWHEGLPPYESRPAKRPRGDSTYLGTAFQEREVKSQRTTPSPATSTTPLSVGSSSPGYSYGQNGYNDPSDEWSARGEYPEDIVDTDAEYARHIQDAYDQGLPTPERRPNVNNTRFVDGQNNLSFLTTGQPGRSHIQAAAQRPGAFSDPREVIDVSSDDDDVIILSEPRSDGPVPAYQGALSTRNLEDSTFFRPNNDIDPWHAAALANHRVSPVAPAPYNDQGFYDNVAVAPEYLSFGHEQSLLDASGRIIDANGNVLNDAWPVPGNPLAPQIQQYAEYVRQDPTKTREEIKTLLENIRPDMEIPPENREGTPEAMLYPLMEHQKLGLAWLKQMEEGSNKGGILADDMGLGKTIQALALIVSRPSTDRNKTTLIIAPVALLKQWEREIDKKLKKSHKLSVCVFHGAAKKAKTYKDLATYDVVLTTFGTIASEYKRKEIYKTDVKDNSELPTPKLLFMGEACKWYRVIVDEAQCIKNKDTQSSKGCHELDAKYRFCLSGTPMQNSCDELYSLLRFLRIRPYNDWPEFSKAFARPLKGRYEAAVTEALRKLQALLKAILLRRTKESQIDGNPILTLPPKEINMVHAVFSSDEQEFYASLESKSKIVFNRYLRANAVGKNYSNLLVLLLRLRQACCHPHLINDIEESNVNPSATNEEMHLLAEELTPEVVTRIRESEALECPVCLDVTENPSIIIPCGHQFCSECLLKVQNQHAENELARGDENSKPKCPGCRGELNPKRIIDLKTFRKVHQPDKAPEVVDEDEHEPAVDDGLIYDSDSDEEVDRNGDLRNFVVRDDEDDDSRDESRVNNKVKGKGKQKAKKGRTLAEVKKDAMRNDKSRRQYHKYLSKRWVDSAKVTKCIEICEDIERKDSSEKTIIFSQFTSLLDLLEVPMSNKKWNYRRYDGSMSAAKRNQALIDFQDDPDVKIVLVSLKAGNAGLNLVAASQIIIFDPFYNPFVEFQAIDRAHRIGQQRTVVVHRLIVAGTVEDRVLGLQEKKRKLIENALDQEASRGVGRLSARDLGYLFGL